MDSNSIFYSLLSTLGSVVAVSIGIWMLIDESRDMGRHIMCHFIEPPIPPRDYKSSTAKFLKIFAIVFIIYALAACAQYREELWALRDTVFLATGLFLFMVFGMIVQVIASNYRNGRDMLDVTTAQIIYPLLFSVIVYYPTWVIGAQSNVPFAVYAAFLNGYFWESVVSETRPPKT